MAATQPAASLPPTPTALPRQPLLNLTNDFDYAWDKDILHVTSHFSSIGSPLRLSIHELLPSVLGPSEVAVLPVIFNNTSTVSFLDSIVAHPLNNNPSTQVSLERPPFTFVAAWATKADTWGKIAGHQYLGSGIVLGLSEVAVFPSTTPQQQARESSELGAFTFHFHRIIGDESRYLR